MREPPELRQRLAVTNALALAMALITMPYIAIFIGSGSLALGLLLILIVVGYACVLGFNAIGLYNLARYTIITVGGVAVAYYSLALGLEAGIHVYFLANLSYPFVVFAPSEKRGQLFGIGLPLALSTALLLRGEQPAWVSFAPAILRWIAFSSEVLTFGTLTGAFCYLALSNERSKGVLRLEVDERRQAEAKLAASEARLRALFDCADDIIFTIDLDRRYAEMSRSIERYGVCREKLIGRRVEELMPVEAAAVYRDAHAGVIATKEPRRVVRKVTWESGAVDWLSTTYSAVLSPSGAVVAVAGIARNITADHHHEAELERARDEAEAANRSKTDFLAAMNHEIRTPISAVLGFTELLAEASLTEEKRLHALAAIQRNGQHLMTLIDSILDLARLESQQLRIAYSRVFLAEEVHEVVEQLQSLAEKKALELSLYVAPGLPRVITTDVIRLRQILFNLIGNALKFTDRGRVTVTVAAAAALAAAGRIAIIVEDSGCGIEPAEQNLLFRPFMQLDPFLARRQGGVGLGLFLMRRLAQAMNGDVMLVRSEPKKGSVFAVVVDPGAATTPTEDLSLLMKQHPPKPTPTGDGGERPGQRLAGVRLLLVDDSDDNRELFYIMLSGEGAEVTVAKDGNEGLALGRSAPFDVVLLDLQMPGLDGYNMAEELRKSGFQAPLIAFTAHANSSEVDRCLRAGFNSFLAKPVTKKALVDEVRKILGRSA